jgi:hypothetical protein
MSPVTVSSIAFVVILGGAFAGTLLRNALPAAVDAVLAGRHYLSPAVPGAVVH